MSKKHMGEDDFNMKLGEIKVKMGEEGEAFVAKVREMKDMLDEADQDDYFGTEGWRRNLGWED